MKLFKCVSQMLEEGSSSMSLYNDIPFLKKVARFTPYVFIIVGGFIALLGGYIKIILGVAIASSGRYISDFVQSRIKKLEAEKEEDWKRTPPQLKATLARIEGTTDYVLVIDFENQIPIKATWNLTTRGNVIVAPILLEKEEIHPNENGSQTRYQQTINTGVVVDEYLKLNFRYYSIYFKEMGSPKDLTGEITQEYRFKDGVLFNYDETVDEGVQ